MRIAVLTTGILSAILVSCGPAGSGSKNYGSISGSIQNASGQTVYLQKFVRNKPVNIDSTVIAADGNFEIQPKEALALNYYSLSLPSANTYCIFIGDSSQDIKIKGEAASLDKQAEISGSKDSEYLQEFYKTIGDYKQRERTLRETLEKDTEKALQSNVKSELMAISREKRQFCIDFIDAKLPSPAVLAALSELDIKQDMGVYVKVKTALSENFAHSEYFGMVSTQIENAQRQQEILKGQAQQVQPKADSKAGKFAQGSMAPDIAMADPEGKTRKLSDLKGKVVLIDFWASWCGPCRRENPNVVNLFKKYNKDGFEVYSVSLDKTAEPWLKAIQTDGLIWKNHVSDLKGWQNEAAKAYGVNSIPYTMLIDKEGKILGTGLRGQMLADQLKAQFGH